MSRNDRDITGSFPEIAARAAALGIGPVILDGEIVALDQNGVPSFSILANRMHVRSPTPGLLRAVPVRLFAFDLLHAGTEPTLSLPYARRRELLEAVGLDRGEITAPPAFTGDGTSVQAAAEKLGLEGVVAKRLTSSYQPGTRTRAWIKVPRHETVDVLVGGWTPGAGRRQGRIGALLVGVQRSNGLVFAGAVGTGFTDTELARLQTVLSPLRISSSPFANLVPKEYARDAIWVAPRLAGEVRIRNWTSDELLRHPSWRGVRTDQ